MLLVTLLSTVAGAATLQVCPACAYDTLSEAVADAAPGDTIELDPGVYADTVDIAFDLVVRGLGAPGDVLLEASGEAPLLVVRDGAVVTIETMTLQTAGYQHVVEVLSSELRLWDVVVRGFAAYEPPDFGGCLYGLDSALTVEESAVEGCEARQGGGGALVTAEQRACAVAVLEDPPFRLAGAGPATPSRVGIAIEF